MIAVLIDWFIAYLIHKKVEKTSHKVLIAFFIGIITSAFTTISIDAFLERKPLESYIQFIIGCGIHPLFTLLVVYILGRKAKQQKDVQQALADEEKRENADYTDQIKAILKRYKSDFENVSISNNDIKERISKESTETIIERINSGYFSEVSLPVALRVLNDRINKPN
jgi:hypothetical protein